MNDIEYFYSLSEKEQNQFLNNIVQNSSQIINKNYHYELFKPKRKSTIPDIEIGYHQQQGRLTYIAKLRNLHNNIPLIRLGANDKKPREINLEDLILETSSYIEKGE